MKYLRIKINKLIRFVKDLFNKKRRTRRKIDTNIVKLDTNDHSIVFEVGGYKGTWSEKTLSQNKLKELHIFEPVKEFVEILNVKFKDNPKVKIHPFGLSNKTRHVEVNLAGDASSHERSFSTDISEQIELIDISEFLNAHNLNQIDFISINIEGGEYALLERLIQTGDIDKFKTIQIQFHDFVKDAERKREDIRKHLKQDYAIKFDFPFVWERWERKN